MVEISFKEHFEKVIELHQIANERALKIAGDELARRLEDLNGEQARIAKIQETYIPRQVGEPRFEGLEKTVRLLETKQAIVDSKAAAWLVWVGLFFTAASFFLSILGVTITMYVVFLK